ncbi:CBS domain-containing protein [Fodinibius salinus]|uniref:CBS domain-containing protein n=1 Tax=Fodinibius salinus TaxID=860790 RepID=A0A5D3YF89_9BACT|nr:CBS domain-containing protein [Fodinibius salinus]TYP91673.1 CBS domain-containing protein [Fodinibius salinus]
MLVNNSLITSDEKPLTGTHTVEEVVKEMQEREVTTLPVVNKATQKLIGQVSLSYLEQQDSDQLLSDLELDEAVKFYIGQHIFEAARLMLQYEVRLLPVVDQEWTFQGFMMKQQVLESLSRMLNLAEYGSVITVELDRINFSLSEIVQLIETEDAKILGVTVERPDQNDQQFEVSFKLNVKDVSRVAAALRRYDYSVITQSGSTVFGEDLEERADELLNYIDM